MTPQTLNPPSPEADAPPDLAERFRELAERWRDETGHIASLTKRFGHPAYREVLALGQNNPDAVTRLLLVELRDRPSFWYEALRTIVGATPVAEADLSNAKRVREAWLQWGVEKGLLGGDA